MCPYQRGLQKLNREEAVNYLQEALRSDGKRALLALDTGLGKSAVVKAVVDHFWQEKGFRSIVIVPSTLVDQTVKTLLVWPWEKPPPVLVGKSCKAKQHFLQARGIAVVRNQQELKALCATPSEARALAP